MYRIALPQPVASLGHPDEVDTFLPNPPLTSLGLQAPSPVGKLVDTVNLDWLQRVSGRIAEEYRILKVGLGEWVRNAKASPILMGESAPLSHLAGAHAWLTALAQQASMEIREAELEVLTAPSTPRPGIELAGVATLASCQHKGSTGRRLTACLKALAADLLVRCTRESTSGELVEVEFVHRKPVQMKSPVDEAQALPLAAYVFRVSGISADEAMNHLKAALSSVTEALGTEQRQWALVLNPATR